jgi:hypothetical protein
MSFFGKNNRRNESIPSSGHGLDKPRGFRVVLQDLANLADRTPDAVVGIKKSASPPDSGNDFVARDSLTPALDEQNHDLQRDTLDLQHAIAAP